MRKDRFAGTLAWQAAICIAVLSIWQWGYDLHASLPWLVPDLLDPYFVSKPSEIFERFLILSCIKSKMGVVNGWMNGDFAKCLARNDNNLWIATAITLKNTFFGFVIGVSSGFAVGLILGRSNRLSAIFQPFITAVNSIPRIALAPIIVLAFGIGDTSKIVTSWIQHIRGCALDRRGLHQRRSLARRQRMADHPHGRDSFDDGLGVRLAVTGNIVCVDRRHRR
jgi:NitT/TauT family transport system permease protein